MAWLPLFCSRVISIVLLEQNRESDACSCPFSFRLRVFPEMKFKLIIAYDGANYAGWQIQKIGLGVQQRVEEAVAKLFPSAPRLHSSSRTDTGVHALGMVAHFEVPDAEFKMPVAKLGLAINAHLPADICV